MSPSRALPGSLVAGLIASSFAIPLIVAPQVPHTTKTALIVILIAGHVLAARGASQLRRQRPEDARRAAGVARAGFAIAAVALLGYLGLARLTPSGTLPMDLAIVSHVAALIAWCALGLLIGGPISLSPVEALVGFAHVGLVFVALCWYPLVAGLSGGSDHCDCTPRLRMGPPMEAILAGLLLAVVTLGIVQVAQWRLVPARRTTARRLGYAAAAVDLAAFGALAQAPLAIAAWQLPAPWPRDAILHAFGAAMLLFLVARQLRRAAAGADLALPIAIIARNSPGERR